MKTLATLASALILLASCGLETKPQFIVSYASKSGKVVKFECVQAAGHQPVMINGEAFAAVHVEPIK